MGRPRSITGAVGAGGSVGTVVGRRLPVVDLDEFPRIGHPATRSLREAGYRSLSELVDVPREQLAQLENIGPKSLRLIEWALRQHGLALR